MSEPPTPSIEPRPSRDFSVESAIGFITILIYDWGPG
jgi:hypothetical protein